MKISVITVLNTRNYGTVLQAYATNKVLSDLGYEVEFVDYYRKDQTVRAGIQKSIRFSRHNRLIRMLFTPVFALDQMRRKSVFRMFLKENIRLTDQSYYSFESLLKNPPSADVYCTGSDQMWNSDWNEGLEKSFFLEFAIDGKRKVAFSTSIGKTEWGQDEATITVPLLHKYNAITVREESAKVLLEKHGIESRVVLDPTLLVDKAFWQSMIGEKSPLKEKYLFVYQLHQKHMDVEFNRYVKMVAKEKGLKIKKLDYGFVEAMKNRANSVYLPSPEEFVKYIGHAEYVITDSFHATAFSINLNKQFSVVYPEKFSTRIDNVLRITGLQSRVKKANSEPEKEIVEFEKANTLLENSRRDSLVTLKEYAGL
ncbi:MAG: polysaccharide pyruvyl transferase family protein [Eubacterium sp.]|nr:polysaccharide pyruvyl transferase family protein [Eubacterium sp.]